jgi:DNA-binding transcriptional LysR family regulator
LRKHKLLYVYTAEEDWRIWLKAAGVEGLELDSRLALDSYILAQEAAVEGRGLAMTIGPFANEELRSGRLVQPFPLKVPHRLQWLFACKAEQKLKPKVRKFEEWLVKQIAKDPDLAPYQLATKA